MTEQDKIENWRFLSDRLFRGDAHKLITDRIANSTSAKLKYFLRHHLPDGINNPAEIAFRRAMDDWLGEVSLLYLSWLSGYSADPSNSSQGNSILTILNHPALKPFYESYYPIALPWLFRLHLAGESEIKAESAPGAFEQFANLYERFRNDSELGTFLNFLDGFSYAGIEVRINVDTVIRSFENPNRIIEAFFRPRSQATPLDLGIVGFLRFATFSTSLYDLLEGCKDLPLLQSAFWFSYAFWYREYEKDAKRLAIQAMKNATAQPSTPDLEAATIAASSQLDIEHVMRALSDGHYATALVAEVSAATHGTPLKAGWTSHFGAYKNPTPD